MAAQVLENMLLKRHQQREPLRGQRYAALVKSQQLRLRGSRQQRSNRLCRAVAAPFNEWLSKASLQKEL